MVRSLVKQKSKWPKIFSYLSFASWHAFCFGLTLFLCEDNTRYSFHTCALLNQNQLSLVYDKADLFLQAAHWRPVHGKLVCRHAHAHKEEQFLHSKMRSRDESICMQLKNRSACVEAFSSYQSIHTLRPTITFLETIVCWTPAKTGGSLAAEWRNDRQCKHLKLWFLFFASENCVSRANDFITLADTKCLQEAILENTPEN